MGRAGPDQESRRRLSVVTTISLDFGNTLLPVARADTDRVLTRTALAISARSGPFDLATFRDVWAEERARQFREEVPAFREVDIHQRVVRVLARLRGVPQPSPGATWDDASAALHSDPAEVDDAVDAYSGAFVDLIPVPPGVAPLLARLASRRRLGILSNWPLAATVDAYLDRAGWRSYFAAVVVSQRVGTIKPHPAIYAATEAALGATGSEILHVGDDWRADVVGPKAAGWYAALLLGRPDDSPLPGSESDGSVEPDAVLERLPDLERILD
jgi:HAD superfamily hydrolase (TIGR01509 family)